MKDKPKTFEQKIADGDLVGIVAAAEISGYSPQHLRRLCHDKKVLHKKRGKNFYFTPEALEALFELVTPR